jgi:hypothetical protein
MTNDDNSARRASQTDSGTEGTTSLSLSIRLALLLSLVWAVGLIVAIWVAPLVTVNSGRPGVQPRVSIATAGNTIGWFTFTVPAGLGRVPRMGHALAHSVPSLDRTAQCWKSRRQFRRSAVGSGMVGSGKDRARGAEEGADGLDGRRQFAVGVGHALNISDVARTDDPPTAVRKRHIRAAAPRSQRVTRGPSASRSETPGVRRSASGNLEAMVPNTEPAQPTVPEVLRGHHGRDSGIVRLVVDRRVRTLG